MGCLLTIMSYNAEEVNIRKQCSCVADTLHVPRSNVAIIESQYPILSVDIDKKYFSYGYLSENKISISNLARNADNTSTIRLVLKNDLDRLYQLKYSTVAEAKVYYISDSCDSIKFLNVPD